MDILQELQLAKEEYKQCEWACITHETLNAILSRLSEKEVQAKSDENAAKQYAEKLYGKPDVFEELDVHCMRNRANWAFMDGCQHVRNTTYTAEEVKALLKQQKDLCYKGVKADVSITTPERAAAVVKATPIITLTNKEQFTCLK